MSDNPYRHGIDRNFWRRSVAQVPPGRVDPVGEFSVRIGRNDRVATAGSCFAQHIARYLKKSGYSYYVAESGHPTLPKAILAEHNYGLFSARYGNIYTARQLLQLMKRAYAEFTPVDDVWTEAEDVVLDPFRPTSQPGGFISEAEMRRDREQHLAAVRTMFENLDIFVFTLGLTECWMSKSDGAVYPLCPGVEGGTFDPDKYAFHNQTVDEVVSDMSSFLMKLARINPRARVVLTVSPVPLMATARKDQHVLTATTYSKSVLRVAAETIVSRFEHVEYFPSYEIITGAFNRGAYYADDLRNVLETGVSHVMGLFMKHATIEEEHGYPSDSQSHTAQSTPTAETGDEIARRAAELVEVECDEAALDRS